MTYMYKRILRPILFSLFKDPEDAHELVTGLLAATANIPAIPALVRRMFTLEDKRLERTVFGVTFPNPVGLAAGFDKHARALTVLAALGFGHIEVGTVTRYAQPGNPRPRMFRLPKDGALINRMGFNNCGAEALAKRLAAYGQLPVPIGISLGKSKITPLSQAAAEYVFSFRTLYQYGDYFAINVSSPNTPGLRELQDKAALEELIAALTQENKKMAAQYNCPQKPLLVKIAPDLTPEAINDVVSICAKYALSGIIAVNTTISRDTLTTASTQAGGLSGAPLRDKALAIVRHIHTQVPHLPIIAAGGIATAEHARAMLAAGASLVQLYTGFIYEGPSVAKNINKGLIKFF